jgi:hypothetical protein
MVDNRVKKNRIHNYFKAHAFVIIACSLVVLAAGLMLARSYYTGLYNTDDVAQQTLLQQTVLGDGKVVKATASGYPLKFPFYVLVNNMLPNTDNTVFATNFTVVILGIGITLLTFVWLHKFVAFYKPALLAAFMVAVLGHMLAGTGANPNYRNIEIGLSFFIMATSLVYLRSGFSLLVWQRVLLGTSAPLLLSFFWFSDPMFLYYSGVPLLLAAITQLTLHRKNKAIARRGAVLAGVLAASYLIYKYVWIYVFKEFFEWSVNPTLGGLIRLEDIAPTLTTASVAFMSLSSGGIDISNVALTNLNVLEIARLTLGPLFMLGGLAASVWVLFDELRSKATANIIVLFFSLLPSVMIGIFLVSGTVVDAGSMRYLLLVPFVLALNYAVFAQRTSIPYARGALIALATLLSSLYVATGVLDLAHRPQQRHNDAIDTKVLQLIEATGLKKGYAPSGVSHYFNFRSTNSLNIVSTYCNPDKIGLFYVLIDEAKIQEPTEKSFYLQYPGAMSNRCQTDDVIDHIGEPSEIIHAPADVDILIYDYDLRSDL